MKKIITVTLSTFFFLITANGVFGQQLPWVYDKGQGNDQLYKKNYAEAIKSFTECIKENDKADECYSGRGMAYLALNNRSSARTNFEMALKINPKNKEAAEALDKIKSVDDAPKITRENENSTIVAGKGWDKIILGASKNEIEKILGASDLEADYLSFHQKSGIFVYFFHDQLAGEISFETSIGKYNNDLKAGPDKNLKWGASAADVIKVYGTSYTKRSKQEEYGGVMLNSIIYSNIEFYFTSDKLVRINVFDGNNRLKSFENSKK